METEYNFLEKEETVKERIVNKELIQISQQQFKQSIKSKYDIYNMFKYGLLAYLPAYRFCSMDFLRELLFGSKKIIYKKDVNLVDVPKW